MIYLCNVFKIKIVKIYVNNILLIHKIVFFMVNLDFINFIYNNIINLLIQYKVEF